MVYCLLILRFISQKNLDCDASRIPDALKPCFTPQGGGLVVRMLYLRSGGPGFKSPPLDGFMFGSLEFYSSTSC